MTYLAKRIIFLHQWTVHEFFSFFFGRCYGVLSYKQKRRRRNSWNTLISNFDQSIDMLHHQYLIRYRCMLRSNGLFYMLKHAKAHVALCTLYHTLLNVYAHSAMCDTKCCCIDLLYLIGLNDRLMKPNAKCCCILPLLWKPLIMAVSVVEYEYISRLPFMILRLDWPLNEIELTYIFGIKCFAFTLNNGN